MAVNRAAFFAAVRADFGRLKQSQVDGFNALLDAWEKRYPNADPRHIAYSLATVWHEVGGLMQPVREGFASSDISARAAVARLHAAGKISRNYALPVNGVSYYGRGRVQNTHLANYEKLERRFGRPFVKNPDLLLDSAIDAEVTVVGHVEGIWTGKKLADYFSATKDDPINARRIINGLDKASLIAGYHKSFLKALKAAGAVSGASPAPAKLPPPPDIPKPEKGDAGGSKRPWWRFWK